MRQHDVKYANLTCLFGDQPLLSFLDPIVIDAFVNDTYYRKRGRTHYHFIDTSIENLGTRENVDFCIVGRFVKSTVLKRTQVLDVDSGKLVKDEQTLETAPSAFFVFRLLGHRLIYLAETPYSPNLTAFEASVAKHLKLARLKHIDQEYEKLQREVTKKSLHEKIPVPRIRVTPISGEDELRSFLERFSIISKVEVTVHERNEEIDGGEMVNLLDQLNGFLDTDKAKVTATSKDEAGANKQNTEQFLAEVGRTGNQSTNVKGTDQEGATLKGNEHDYSITDRLDPPPVDKIARAKKMLSMLKSAAENRAISLGNTSKEIAAQIRNTFR